MQKASADAAAAADEDQGSGRTGIILKRQAKPTAAGGSAGSKPGDVAALAGSVQVGMIEVQNDNCRIAGNPVSAVPLPSFIASLAAPVLPVDSAHTCFAATLSLT